MENYWNLIVFCVTWCDELWWNWSFWFNQENSTIRFSSSFPIFSLSRSIILELSRINLPFLKPGKIMNIWLKSLNYESQERARKPPQKLKWKFTAWFQLKRPFSAVTLTHFNWIIVMMKNRAFLVFKLIFIPRILPHNLCDF
jgi:hypothetical protein